MASEQFPVPQQANPTWTSPAGPVQPGSWSVLFNLNSDIQEQLVVPGNVWRHVYRTDAWFVVNAGHAAMEARISLVEATLQDETTKPSEQIHWPRFLHLIVLDITNVGLWGNQTYWRDAERYALQPGSVVAATVQADAAVVTGLLFMRQWFIDSPTPMGTWA